MEGRRRIWKTDQSTSNRGKSKMKFDLGDRVRILESGQTGSICDARMFEGRPLYIVDCFGECESESVIDCVIPDEEYEIEAI